MSPAGKTTQVRNIEEEKKRRASPSSEKKRKEDLLDLWEAAESGNLGKIAELELRGSVDFNSFNASDDCLTALHYAARAGQSLIIEYLVRRCGANTKARTLKKRATPLELAQGQTLRATGSQAEALRKVIRILKGFGDERTPENRKKLPTGAATNSESSITPSLHPDRARKDSKEPLFPGGPRRQGFV